MSADPLPAGDDAKPDPADAELIRQAEEIFRAVEGKPFVSDSLQHRNEWITESPAPDLSESEEDDDDAIL
jgi:hypothetical protein